MGYDTAIKAAPLQLKNFHPPRLLEDGSIKVEAGSDRRSIKQEQKNILLCRVVSSQALTIPSTVAETYMLTSNFGNLCNCSGGEAEALHSL
ncbi:hypothetical protein YC2023_066984 [Brassica napus]